MLDINMALDHKMLREIYAKGFSRIPVYDGYRDNIVGILMARDLILINPEKALITLKQMSSIIIREVVAVGEGDKLEPLLGYFKKGLTHIGIVTKIMEGDNRRDNFTKVIGIVTLEDIIEEIIQEEIEDENDEFSDEKNAHKLVKEKLVMLFTDHEANKVLSEQEIQACLDFLSKYVKPFKSSIVKRDVLNMLIRKSTVFEIESDETYFSHNIDFYEGKDKRFGATGITPQQQMYNFMRKNEEGKEQKMLSNVQAGNQEEMKRRKSETFQPKILQAHVRKSEGEESEKSEEEIDHEEIKVGKTIGIEE